MVEEHHHVQQEPEHEENVCKVECEPWDDEDVTGDDGAPGSQEVGDNQDDVDQDWEDQIRRRILENIIIKVIWHTNTRRYHTSMK